MFQSLRESVLKLASEEQERKAGNSSHSKKKKKKKYEQRVVNAERIVLFDFQAAPEYKEQVSLKANEIVFEFESFEDGWSQVKTQAGRQGVVPTAYLGSPLEKESVNSKSFFSAQFKQRSKVLGMMAVEQFKVKSIAAAELLFKATKFAITELVIPTGIKLFLIASRNESYITTVSSMVRRVFEVTSSALVHTLSDEELASFGAQLREDSAKIKAEKLRRAELGETIPPRDASTTATQKSE